MGLAFGWVAQEGFLVEYTAPLAMLLLGLVTLGCAWSVRGSSQKFVAGGCGICEWPLKRPPRMTNTLGYLEFAAQGRTKESMLAALDLDLLYTISFHGRTILTRDSKEWDGLQLRQGIWRSIPLGMVQLPGPRQCLDSGVDCLRVHMKMIHRNRHAGICGIVWLRYLASRALLEMPQCNTAMNVAWFPIGLELENYTDLPVFGAYPESEWSTEIWWLPPFRGKLAKSPNRQNLQQTLGSPRLYALCEQLWRGGRCDRSSWEWAEGDLSSMLFDIRLDPRKEGLGPVGHGNLNAFKVYLGRTWRRSLIQHGGSLKGDLQHVAERFGSTKGKAVGVLAGAYVGVRDWPGLVDSIFKILAGQDGFGLLKYSWPRQDRLGWQLNLAKAAVLLISSCSPLVKAILTARKVHGIQPKILLAVHSALDISIVVLTALWSSVSHGARVLGYATQNLADNLVRLLIQESSFFTHTLLDFFLKRCHISNANNEACPDLVVHVRKQVVRVFEECMKAVEPLNGALRALEMPPEQLMKLGLGFFIFCGLSIRWAVHNVPHFKTLHIPGRALVNLGIAGPLHLAVLVPDCAVPKVLGSLVYLVFLRGLFLTGVIAVTGFGVHPEAFMAFTFNRLVTRLQLVIAWLGLWLACLGQNTFRLSTFR